MRRKSSLNIGRLVKDSLTYGTSMALFSPEQMSWSVVSHARMFRLPEQGRDSKGSEALFGGKCFDSFAKLSPDGSWLKTSQGYSQVMLDGSLETFSEIW